MKDPVQLDLFTGEEVRAAFRREGGWNDARWSDVRWVCARCARVYFQSVAPTKCVCAKKKSSPGATFGGS